MREGITPDDALGIVLDEVAVLPTETVAARDALGRVLGEPVVSGRRIPPADNSAMDGYAVRAADLVDASAETPRDLPVVFEVAAGATPEATLGAGEAARILTGAPLPPGADSVVRQEDVAREGDRVRVRVAPVLREHVRSAGEDVEPGDRVLEAGTLLGSAHLGFLASLGRLVVKPIWLLTMVSPIWPKLQIVMM